MQNKHATCTKPYLRPGPVVPQLLLRAGHVAARRLCRSRHHRHLGRCAAALSFSLAAQLGRLGEGRSVR